MRTAAKGPGPGQRLTPSPTATTAVVDGDLVVYCERSERIHCLDRSASLVWALCDGTRNLAAVVDEVAVVVAKASGDVKADVKDIVARFRTLGILR